MINYSEKYVHGKIEGTSPSKYPKFVNNDPFNLNVRDIEGTQAGSKNKFNKFNSNDYSLRNDDIMARSKKYVQLFK